MSVLFQESFDTYGTTGNPDSVAYLAHKWASIGNSYVTSDGRNGNGAVVSGNLTTPQLTESYQARWSVGFAYKTNTSATMTPVKFKLPNGTTIFELTRGVDHLLYFRPLSGGVLVTDSSYADVNTIAVPMNLYRWYYIFFTGTFTVREVKVADVVIEKYIKTETALLYVNGSRVMELRDVCSETGIAVTQPGVTTVEFTGSIEGVHTFDDIVVGDFIIGTFFDCQVERLAPVGTGAVAQWTATTTTTDTNNWQCVDDTIYNTSDYVACATTSQLDVYSFSTLGTGITIGAVGLGVIAENTVTGSETGALAAPACVSGTTTYVGDTSSMSDYWRISGASWDGYWKVFDTDPNTTSTWLATNCNAADFGMYQVTESAT